MTKQNFQMMFAVVVVTILSLTGAEASKIELGPEPASIVLPAADTPVDTVEPEPEAVAVDSPTKDEGVALPESFNETELESEFGEVQTGIDLLDSPLQ